MTTKKEAKQAAKKEAKNQAKAGAGTNNTLVIYLILGRPTGHGWVEKIKFSGSH